MYENTIKEIANKIARKTKNAGKKSLIVHWDDTVSSTLCLQLAIESKNINNINVFCLCFGSKIILDTKEKEIKKYFKSNVIFKGFETPKPDALCTIDTASDNQRFNIQDMLIQSVLFHFADFHNGLVVGSINKTMHAERLYFKYGPGLADIFPILDIYTSDCIKILNELLPEFKKYSDLESDNLFNIEWAIKENERTNILDDIQTPNKNKNWFKYTTVQKEALSWLHQRQKLTNHKKLESGL